MKFVALKKKGRIESRADQVHARRCFSTIEVCLLFDISKATLYRWEREGLISMPTRDWRNWRLYATVNVEEIKRLIRRRRSQ